MDWMQVLTILTVTVGSTYAFYIITAGRIDRMENFHREDVLRMDNLHREDMVRMEEKWERLFERLLIQDKAKQA